MNHQCSICCETFKSSNELCSPPCGHVFHFHCLSQWLERSETCPQCRQKTNSSEVHRLYFHNSINSTESENLATLQEKLNSLELEIKLKDTRLNRCKSESQTLKKRNEELTEELDELEFKMNQKKGHIKALRNENLFLTNMSIGNEMMKLDLLRIQKQLKNADDSQQYKEALEVKNKCLKDITAENETLKNDNLRLEEQLKDREDELTLANTKLNKSLDKIKKLKRKLKKYKTKKVAGSNEQENSNEDNDTETPNENYDDTNESNENAAAPCLKVYNLRSRKKNK